MPGRTRTHRMDLDPGLFADYTHAAEAMDLPTTTLVEAVLRGVFRTGQVERLANLILADAEVRRRPRVGVRKWTARGGENAALTPGHTPPAVWSSGPWELHRDRPTSGANRSGQWWLHGPGLPEPWPTGQGKRAEAVRAADERIAILEAQAPVTVNGDAEEPPSPRCDPTPAEAARALHARVHPEAER